MTVASENNRVSYSASIGTGPYPYTWKILASDELLVYDGDTLLTETTHYTVSGVGTDAGGNVTLTYTPTATNTILIVDAPAYTQETDYTENDPFPAAAHENALDKLTRLCLRLKEAISRTIKVTITSSLTEVELPIPSAGQIIGWNSTATGMTNYNMADVSGLTVSDLGASLVQSTTATSMVRLLAASDMAASIVRGTTGDDVQSAMGITAFARSLLDDATAAIARNTLSVGLDQFEVYSSGTTSLAAVVYTKLPFDTFASSVADSFSTPLNRFTAPETRKYLLSAMAYFKKIATAGIEGFLHVYKNGSVFRSIPFQMISSTVSTHVCGPSWSAAIELNAADYIEIYAYCNTSVSVVGGLGNSYFSGVAL
uniref:Putative tail protein n=1 Tax=viral metagenome TaxID=1070528 RepID=A0A6M3KFK8_9ZZZZ